MDPPYNIRKSPDIWAFLIFPDFPPKHHLTSTSQLNVSSPRVWGIHVSKEVVSWLLLELKFQSTLPMKGATATSGQKNIFAARYWSYCFNSTLKPC